ncbi:MAG: multi-sensor signal transduction histidine kinase, partial [Chloroflexi bacterium]|nr:multi-sensor signal transduction histidine kinase [Chloroflexota bacterium]
MQGLMVLLLSDDERLSAHVRSIASWLGHSVQILPLHAAVVDPTVIAGADAILLDYRQSDAAPDEHRALTDKTHQPVIAIVPPNRAELAFAALSAGASAIVETPVTRSSLRLALIAARFRSAAVERASDREMHRLRWLQEGPRSMAQCQTIGEIVSLAADHVQHGLGFDRIGISVLDEPAGVVRDWISTDTSGNRYLDKHSELAITPESSIWKWPAVRAFVHEGKDFYYTSAVLEDTPDELRHKLDGLTGDNLVVALRLGARLLGWISVDNLLGGKPISPMDAPPLVAFAREVAAALDKVQLYRAAERRAQEFAALAEVSVAVAAQHEPKSVCQTALDQLVARFGYDLVSIYMREGDHLACQAVHGFTTAYETIRDTGVIARMMREGASQLVLNTSQDPDYLGADNAAVAELCVPILIDEQVVGAINVETKKHGVLDNQAQELLEQLARHVAVALRNARMHAEATRHLGQMDWLHGATRDLARCEMAHDVLNCAVDSIRNGLGRAVSISLVEEHPPALCEWRPLPPDVAAAYGTNRGDSISLQADAPAWRYQPLKQLLLGGAEFTLLDAATVDCPEMLRTCRSNSGQHLLVALRTGNQGDTTPTSVRGIIRLDLAGDQSFDPDLIPVLIAFANHVATALERARLLELERRRARFAEALERATAAISFSLDTADIFGQVLTVLREVVQFDSATVIHFNNGLCSDDPNSAPFNRFGGNDSVYKLDEDPIFSSWIQAGRREPELIPDTRRDPRWNRYHETAPSFAEAVQCYLGTPLVIEGDIVGALCLSNMVAHSFDAFAVAAAAEFAERLSQALRNARLYQLQRSANAKLESAMRLQDEFVATVSHELRTPLTSILGFSETLLSHWERMGDGQRRANVEKVHRSGTRLDRLVRDLLYVSRVESGSFNTRPSQQRILSLARRAIEELAIKFPGQIVDIDTTVQGASVWADGERLSQVLGNLLDNAAKYSPEGSSIAISWENDGRWGTLSVHDSGPGIAADNIRKLFRRFGKLDSTTRSGHVGTGLGLYICRQLVERMGGR